MKTKKDASPKPMDTADCRWCSRVLDLLDFADEAASESDLFNLDKMTTGAKSTFQALAKQIMPAVRMKRPSKATPKATGCFVGQQCANVYGVVEWMNSAGGNRELVKKGRRNLKLLQQEKHKTPGADSCLRVTEIARQQLASFSDFVPIFRSRVLQVFGEVLLQPYCEALAFFRGYSRGLGVQGFVNGKIAKSTLATPLYLKMFFHGPEIAKLKGISQLREFLLRNGVPKRELTDRGDGTEKDRSRRLEQIHRRLKLGLAKRGRPAIAKKSDTRPR